MQTEYLSHQAPEYPGAHWSQTTSSPSSRWQVGLKLSKRYRLTQFSNGWGRISKHLKCSSFRGAWVAQTVKHLTLALGSGHDLMVHEFEPFIGLCVGSVEPAWDSLSLSLSLSLRLLCLLPLSLSQNKINIKNFSKTKIKIKCSSFTTPYKLSLGLYSRTPVPDHAAHLTGQWLLTVPCSCLSLAQRALLPLSGWVHLIPHPQLSSHLQDAFSDAPPGQAKFPSLGSLSLVCLPRSPLHNGQERARACT